MPRVTFFIVTLLSVTVYFICVAVSSIASVPTEADAGRYMVLRLVQLPKARFPMEVTPLGIVMLVRLVQLAKAFIPMELTLLGIVMLVRLEQLLKALLPMEVTDLPSIVSGIVTEV